MGFNISITGLLLAIIVLLSVGGWGMYNYSKALNIELEHTKEQLQKIQTYQETLTTAFNTLQKDYEKSNKLFVHRIQSLPSLPAGDCGNTPVGEPVKLFINQRTTAPGSTIPSSTEALP